MYNNIAGLSSLWSAATVSDDKVIKYGDDDVAISIQM